VPIPQSFLVHFIKVDEYNITRGEKLILSHSEWQNGREWFGIKANLWMAARRENLFGAIRMGWNGCECLRMAENKPK
jgi:hypothetical protein